MRLIVIGASGFIGSSIYRFAKLQKIDVVGTSTKGGNNFFAYDLLNDNPKVLLKCLSNTDAEKNFAVVAAAKTNIKFCYENEQLANKINVEAMKNLLTFLDSEGVKSIYFSSDYVFDGKTGNYKEDSPVNPLGVYGKQKAIMEEFILSNLPKVLIYRITKSLDGDYRDKNLFKEFFDDYREGKILRCISGLTFNPTFVDDLAECVLLGLQKNLSGLYNVANPETFTRFDLVKKFFACRGIEYKKIIEEPLESWNFSEPKPLNTTLNVSKFQSVINKKFTSTNELIQRFWKNLEVVTS